MMSQPDRSEPRKVTVEDLLRLKRAERPSAEFWSQFEEDLRAKQLAAIIEKRPWWITLRLPQVARAMSRLQVPLGATAVLALSFAVVREYRPASSTIEVIPAVQTTAAGVILNTGENSVPVDVVSSPKTTASRIENPKPEIAQDEVQPREREPVPAPLPVESGELMAMIPWAVSQTGMAAENPSELSQVGELSGVHFASVVNPGRDHDFESRVDVGSVVVATAPVISPVEAAEPVQVSPVSPREVRRNRILSNLVVADNSADGAGARIAQGREVLTSSLDEDRLYDTVRRLGMGGDRLTLKF